MGVGRHAASAPGARFPQRAPLKAPSPARGPGARRSRSRSSAAVCLSARPPVGRTDTRPPRSSRLTMHCHAEVRLSSPGQLKAARRRYKTFMIDEILSKETCDYFERLSLYSVCPSLVVRPKPLHSCTGKMWPPGGALGGAVAGQLVFCYY